MERGKSNSASAFTRLRSAFRATRWVMVFVIWTLVGLFDLAQQVFDGVTSNSGVPSLRSALFNLGDTWLWVLLTPVIFWLCDVFPIDRARWRQHIGVHVLATVGFATFETALLVFISAHRWPELHRAPIVSRFLGQVFIDAFSYVGVAGAAHATAYYQLYVERRLCAAELETELEKARLQALATQLQPHFLFNTLHSIASLIRSKRDADAIKMVTGFGDLLRASLLHDGVQEVAVREELEFVERYLDLQQLRFRDRLRVEIDVDPAVLDALLPFLILQPLVENAVRHGIELGDGTAHVAIHVGAVDAMLCVRVHNWDERRESPPAGDGHGIGLSNTRARLRGLYRDRGALELTRDTPNGALIRLTLPLHRTPWEAGA